jgi:hypothetical protein
MLMECLEMRQRWLFQPAIGPEQRRVSRPAPPDPPPATSAHPLPGLGTRRLWHPAPRPCQAQPASSPAPPRLTAPRPLAPLAQHEPEAASPSEVCPQPLEYHPVATTGESWAAVEGVVRVLGPDGTNLFPVPGNATDFFTDMHRWGWRAGRWAWSGGWGWAGAAGWLWGCGWWWWCEAGRG